MIEIVWCKKYISNIILISAIIIRSGQKDEFRNKNNLSKLNQPIFLN